jgi:hypothetical protein
MLPTSAQLWGLRVLFFGSLIVLPGALAGSNFPAFAFALAWGPNGLFLMWFMRGALRLPRLLMPVQPMEPVLYRWVGVGFVKRIVATRIWPLMHGGELPQSQGTVKNFWIASSPRQRPPRYATGRRSYWPS